MNKRIVFSIAVVLLASLPALSQQPQSAGAGNPSAASANLSKKEVRISGKVGEEGKTFVCDKDHRTLKVNNPAILREIAGRLVRVKALVTQAGDEIFITSVKIVQQEPVAFHSGDSAFRR
jgi:hypothetical protein